MKVGYVGGFWSTNIGNAFYNLGAIWLLKKILGDQNVFLIPDPPQEYWGKLRGDFDLIPKLDLDMIIITGPSLNVDLINVYGNRFDSIAARGGSIGLLSVGASEYTEEEADKVSEFLNKYNLSFVFTRDSVTYSLYKDRLNCNVYDGLCTSMFLNDAYSPVDVNDDYLVYNFPIFHQPYISKCDEDWKVTRKLFGKQQVNLLGYPIVRIKSSPYIPNIKKFKSDKLVYPIKNMYYSDLPYGYLSILKSSKYIFSDRVHTCAAGLIYGVECMYIKSSIRSKDGRNNLFARLKLQEIYDRPVSLDFNYINGEKESMMNALELLLNP